MAMAMAMVIHQTKRRNGISFKNKKRLFIYKQPFFILDIHTNIQNTQNN